jgi:hypothetical protein
MVLDSADVRKAIEIVEHSRWTHAEWIRYCEEHPDEAARPTPQISVAGDADFHRSRVERYDHVLRVLRSLLEP